MTYTSIRDLTRRKRFQPFVIQTTAGEIYTVRHLEGFLLTLDHIVIGLLKDEFGQDYERSVYIDLTHIVRVEPLPIPASAKGNGQSEHSA